MEGRHPLPLAGERHLALLWLLLAKAIPIDARLPCGDEERNLGWISHRAPPIAVVHEVGAICECANSQRLEEQWVFSRTKSSAIIAKLAFRLVGRAADRDLSSVHHDGAHRHFAGGERA